MLCFRPLVFSALIFYLAAFLLVFGCGALLLLPFERTVPVPERTTLACALGLVIAPTLLCLLSVLRLAAGLAPIACALSLWMAARWFVVRRPLAPSSSDARWYVILPAIVFAVTAWTSAGRITWTTDTLAIYGDYETFDLTYYAAIGSELAHTTTLPPLSPFYAGHRIVYSYLPLMLLAGLHNLTGVGTTQTFLAFGWPMYTAMGAASMFAFCRRLGSVPFAAVATLLVFTGSTFAYVAAWQWPDMVKQDPLIWSSMFLGPSAEWVLFNPWAPALAVTGAGLYALTRLDEARPWPWAAIACLCFGSLFMFKSFAFPVVLGALIMSAAVYALRKDRLAWRLTVVIAGTVAVAAPWLLIVLPYNRVENRGAQVIVSWFWLVRRMLLKTDLIGPIEAFLRHFTSGDPKAWEILTVASAIFLIGGMGLRWLGVGALVRAAAGRPSLRHWTPLAWIVIVGVAASFVFEVAPFPNSIQTYLFALFAMWPFAALTLWPARARPSIGRWLATALVLGLSVPSTVHYVRAAHAAAAGPPIASLTAGDFQIIRALRRTNQTTTVTLQSNPKWPSLYAIESERRAALAWSSYVEGDGNAEIDASLEEIARFFGSPQAAGAPDTSVLRRWRVTHVIERTGTDQLNPEVVRQLHLVTGTPEVRLYEVPPPLRR